MKKNAVIFPFLMSVVLAACSSDESDEIKPGNTGDSGYVAVSIVQANTIGGRAGEAPGFEYGSEDENSATSGLFYIFDNNGENGTSQIVSLAGSGTTTTPAVERIYDAVLLIDGVNDDPNAAGKQIVCILNAPAGFDTNISTLAGLQEEIGNYRASAPGSFIMTNSVYKNGDNEVLGAEITADNIKKSAIEAKANPVQIYVERVVAKVRLKSNAGFTDNKAELYIDGKTKKELAIKVTGIEIANIADESYLFKKISGINLPWNWNDVTNVRSYWETIPSLAADPNAASGVDRTVQFENQSYTTIVNGSKPAVAEGEEATEFDIKNFNVPDQYIQPNTSAQKTAVLVTAKLMDGNKEADLAYIRGTYTTKDDALKEVASYLKLTGNYWKKAADGKSYTQLEPADFVWKNENDGVIVSGATKLERYQVVAQLGVANEVTTPVTEIYKRVDDVTFELITNGVTEVNNYLLSEDAKSYRAEVFKDGMCYYYVNIDQTLVANERKPAGVTEDYALGTYEGVVRNHIYELTLNSIKGIGTPVFDPDDVIIPERVTHDDMFYLAARVNVLAWRLVTQNVDFEGN